ncbi:hypothetical protein D3C78_1159070 [compost metagenome]
MAQQLDLELPANGRARYQLVTGLHQPACRQGGQVGRTAGAARRAVDPPRWQGGAGLVGAIVQAVAEHHVGHFIHRRQQRVLDVQLAVDHLLQRHAGIGQGAGMFRGDRQAGLRHVDQGVVHAAKRHIDVEGAELLGLDGQVQVLDEGGHHFQRHAQATAVRATGVGGYQAGGGVQHHRGLGLLHRHHAQLQQGSDHADAVAAGHRVGLVRLQHDKARVGFRAGWRQQQVDRHLQATARLQRYQAAQAVIHLVDVVHLVQHAGAGDAQYAASDDLADFAFAVHFGQLEGLFPTHGCYLT